MRFEEFRDDISACVARALLQFLDFLYRHFLGGRIVDGFAIRSHGNFSIAAHVRLVGFPICFPRALNDQ